MRSASMLPSFLMCVILLVDLSLSDFVVFPFQTSAQKNVMLRETLEKIAKLGLAPLSVVKGNKRVERVQTEKKKEGKVRR